MKHSMEKNHYILFMFYVTSGHFEAVRHYPEQNPQARFLKKDSGDIYAYCEHGLYRIKVPKAKN